MKRKTLFNLFFVLSLSLASTILLIGPLAAEAEGSGLFVDSGQSLGNSFSVDVALGDVDGDGDLDAFVANGLFGNTANKVWLNDGTGIFTDSGQSLGNLHSVYVALGDVDGDGDLDAFVANMWAIGNRVWLNNGTGIFSDSGQSLGSGTSEGVELGDVDDDGDLDAFVVNFNQPNKVWLNDGTGTFTDNGQNLGAFPSYGVALGDVDGDSDLDAFVANVNQPNQVWLNDGTGMFSDSGQSLGGNLQSFNVDLGDLDGDGDLDAFVANDQYGNEVWLNDGAGTFTDSGQVLGSGTSGNMALGDVDGDGDLDAFVANSGRTDQVWLNDGTGTFTDSGQSLDGGSTDQSADVALGDVDSDGDLDAFVTYTGYTSNPGQPNKVWLNIVVQQQQPTCDEILQWAVTPEVSLSGKSMTAFFTPNFGLTLDDAAQECGYDHFNWIQWVTFDNSPFRPTVGGVQPPIPYLDPPLGGWDYQQPEGDDFRVGYWNEFNGELDLFSSTYTLEFQDAPTVQKEPYSVRFKTALAGVELLGYTEAIGSFFEWEATSIGIQELRKNLDESLVIMPGIELLGVFPITELSQIDIDFLTSQGIGVRTGQEIIPEPMTLLLVGTGLLGILVFARRKLKKRK